MAASEEPSDEDLIARIAAGDRDAFAALYRRRRPDVYRFALHVPGSPPVADDVTQDVFMAVIHHAERYRPGRSGVVPWLLGITRNYVRRSADAERPTLPVPDADSDAGRGLLTFPERKTAAEGRATWAAPARRRSPWESNSPRSTRWPHRRGCRPPASWRASASLRSPPSRTIPARRGTPPCAAGSPARLSRSEEHTSEL